MWRNWRQCRTSSPGQLAAPGGDGDGVMASAAQLRDNKWQELQVDTCGHHLRVTSQSATYTSLIPRNQIPL